ncbi:hypothetical protein Clacol_008557 [Clathrus columnatus]|uniref:Chromatin modification-related protein EAF3 n=1 Tax=Clathrus columnatus TaxID=1419009 RepID=A0AAV5ANP9_9AGAM|nr:hypothetical protein Clacol_008557 [Clathrus columnatus]
MSTPAPVFQVNERVLCYHGPLIYEAKVLKVETWDEKTTRTGGLGPHYFVHYKGWKQTWDEFVPPDRVLKYNETNIGLQKKLAAAAQKTAPAAAAKAAPPKEGTTSTDDPSRKPDLKLSVPDTLKVILVDDWEAVTKNKQVRRHTYVCFLASYHTPQLVTLPREPTVHDLLQEFKDYIDTMEKKPDHTEAVPTIIAGLQLYFDRSLGANLLYRFERMQYAEIRRRYVTGPMVKVGEEKDMSAVYGAEHLLRMIVSLPTMIGASNMDPESVNVLREYVQELMNPKNPDDDAVDERFVDIRGMIIMPQEEVSEAKQQLKQRSQGVQ